MTQPTFRLYSKSHSRLPLFSSTAGASPLAKTTCQLIALPVSSFPYDSVAASDSPVHSCLHPAPRPMTLPPLALRRHGTARSEAEEKKRRASLRR